MPIRETDLSVIVVTHDGRDLALRTLRSARARAGGLVCEWIVVDSGSRDGTPDAIESALPDIRVVRRPNIGFAAASNVALREACGRHVLLLNPDVEILDGELIELVAALDARPGVGAASVIHVDASGELLPSVMRFPSVWRQIGEAFLPRRMRPAWLHELVRPGPVYRREIAADWVSGAFLIARGAALRAVGSLDERFFLYSEETDLCRRMHRAGWRVAHLPVMTIAHYGGACERPELAAQLCRSKLLYAHKHHGRAEAGAMHAALAAGHALRFGAAALLAATRPAARRRLAAERAALAAAVRFEATPSSYG